MIAFAEVPIGTGGITSCVRCSPPTQSPPRPLAAIDADLSHASAAFHRDAAPNVAFVGSEPFAHPELPQVIAAATARGFERIRLRTDGGALVLHGNAHGVLGAGVHHIEVVLLGDQLVHDKLSGREGLFDSALMGAKAFAAAASDSGVDVCLTVFAPICKHNLSALPAIAVTAAVMGASSITFDATGIARTPQSEAFMESALSTSTINLIAATVLGWPDVDFEYRQGASSIQGWSS